MAKQTIKAGDLNALLANEFAKARPAGCGSCAIPKPFWGPSAGLGSGYWYMATPADCPHGCRKVIAEIWARVTTDYEIAPPQKDVVA